MIDSHLVAQLEERGYKARIVSIHRLYELQEEIEERYRQGLFDEQFYQENLASFAFSPPDSLPEARSLIVVAVPRPQFQLVFTWRGKPVPVLVPTYYLRWREVEKRLEDSLAKILSAVYRKLCKMASGGVQESILHTNRDTAILSPSGHRVIQAALPKKLLAVRSGLGQYGKNNICYVPGMGSFHRLWTFYSDLVCQEANWQEAQMMERCQNCSACLRKCPTGAIVEECFLLRAERCLTLHNEQPGDVPFPAWIDPGWHNCLIGCSYCQNVCPQNKDFRQWIEKGAEFSEEETGLLLEGVPLDQLPAPTIEKLKRLDLVDYANLLPRNLGALFHQL